MKKYERKRMAKKENGIAVMLLCVLCTLVFGIWMSSGAWFGDRDEGGVAVTLATIEVDSNTNESLRKTVWVALRNQQILSDDVTFNIAQRSSDFYARIGVFVTTDSATSQVAKDVIKFQNFTPMENEGYTWVRDGEWYYFCDTNGKPAVLSHKNTGQVFGFMGKDSFVMPNGLRPEHYASDDTVELEIRVESVQSRNVEATTATTLAPYFTTQYPTEQYTVEFRDSNNKTLKTQTVSYAGDVTPPSAPTVTGKVFEAWNTVIDGTGADIVGEEFNNISQNLVLYPRYKSNDVTVTVVQTANGQISPGTTTTTYGSDLTFQVKANGGYEISSITSGGTPIAVTDKNEQEVKLSNIVGDTTLTATYSLKSYTITVVSSGDGTTTPSESQSVRFGDDVSFSFAAGEGKYISSLKIDGIEKIAEGNTTTLTSSHTFTGVSSDHSVDVVYDTRTYNITTSVNAYTDGNKYGTISPTSNTCAHGKSVSFVVSAYDGARISSIKVGGSEQLSGSEVTKTNITVTPTSDTSVVVTFAPLWTISSINSKYYVTAYLGSSQNVVVPANIYNPATGGNVAVYGVRSLNNNSITSLTLSSGIQYVGGNGSNNIFGATSSNVTSITLPKTVKIIDTYAFLGCGSITSFTVPSALEQIGAHAFDGCSGITAYNMPKTLLSIGLGAFDNNTSLSQLTFNSTAAPTVADGSIFAGTTSNLVVRVPTSGKASYVSNLSNRSFAEGTYMYPLTGTTPIAKYVNNVFRYIYYIDILNGTGGTSSPTGRVEAYETQNFSITFTPSTGNRIEAIYVDSSSENELAVAEGNPQTYTFTNIQESHVIEAMYSRTYIKLDINGGTGNQPLVEYDADKTQFRILDNVEPTKSGKTFYYYSTNAEDNEQGQNGTRYDLGLWYDIPNVNASTTLYAIYLTPTNQYTTSAAYIVVPTTVTALSGTSGKNIFGSTSDATVKFVTLHRNTKTIGSYALYGCTGLLGISYSDGTEQIGDNAFAGCTSLTSFRFSPSLSTLGASAFSGCTKLANITNFENTEIQTISASTFQSCSALASIDFPTTLISIGNNAFQNCSKLATLDLSGTGTTSIGTNAFSGCSNISTIKLPSTLLSIGDGAFKNCSNLKIIYDFDKTKTTTIGANAFEGCTSLSSIKFPTTLSSLGEKAFYGCTTLATVSGFNSTKVSTLSESTFENCTALTTIQFGSSLTTIGKAAMKNCSSLTSLTSLSSSKVTTIGEQAFYGTTKVVQMSLPTGSFKSFGVSAFENSGVQKITNLKSCSKLTTVGTSAFKGSGLKEIEFPTCAFTLSESAFQNCASLTKVTFNNATAPTCAGTSIFAGTPSDIQVFIPSDALNSYAPLSSTGGLHNTGFASGTDSLLTSYTAVDYIQATGSQYINTGFVPTVNTKVETTFTTSTDGKWLYGSRTSYGATDTFAAHLYPASNSIWFQIAGASTPQQSVTYSGKKITLVDDKSYMYVDGKQINSTAFTSSSFAKGSYPMYLGALNEGGSVESRIFVGQIYSCKIWDNNTLVRDFVPVKRNSDGAVGLYDLVEGKFYANAGTGSFTAGGTTTYTSDGATMHIKGSSKQMVAMCVDDVFKRVANISMADAKYYYDGSTRTMAINEETPSNASVIYSWTASDGRSGTGNTFTEIGEYTVTARVMGQYYVTTSAVATLVIYTPPLNVQLLDKTVEYDGTEHSITITGTLLDGGSVTYSGGTNAEGNGATNAGTYTITATFGGIYSSYKPLTATLTITKKTVKIALIDTKEPYDGNPHTVGIQTYDYTGVSISKSSYTGTKADGTAASGSATGSALVTVTEAGRYVITASFNGGQNYIIPDASAELYIYKINIAYLVFAQSSDSFTYTGNNKTYTAICSIASATITYSWKEASGKTGTGNAFKDVGVYTLTASVAKPDDYEVMAAQMTITINPAKLSTWAGSQTNNYTGSAITYTNWGFQGWKGTDTQSAYIDSISWSYLGSEYTVSGSLSSTQVKGTTNSIKNAGVYTISATAITQKTNDNGKYNYTISNDISNTFTITRITSMEFVVKSVTAYSGMSFKNTLNNSFGTISYTSDRPALVTVASSSGLVTVTSTIADRKTTVTITANSSAGYGNVKPATFTITLLPYVISGNTITLYTSSYGHDGTKHLDSTYVTFPDSVIHSTVNSSGYITSSDTTTTNITTLGDGSNALVDTGRTYGQITIASKITTIKANALKGCTTTTKLIFQSAVSSIASSALSGMTGLTTIQLTTAFSDSYTLSNIVSTWVWRYKSTAAGSSYSGTSAVTTLKAAGYYYKVAQNAVSVTVSSITTWYSFLSSAWSSFYNKTATVKIYQDQSLTPYVSRSSITGSVTFKSNGYDYAVKISADSYAGSQTYYSAFTVGGGTLTFNDANLTLSGNSSQAIKPLVTITSGTFNLQAGTLTSNKSANGGGVYVGDGTFNMSGGTISSCTATTSGGAVYVNNNDVSNFTMSGGTISGCSATNGGGVYVNTRIFNFNNGTISSCYATNGGGVYNTGTLTRSDESTSYSPKISKCYSNSSSSGLGGGVYNTGTATLYCAIEGCYIYSSTSTYGSGGGVYNAGTLDIQSSCQIGSCNAANGGGVYVNSGRVTTYSDAWIGGNGTANTATSGGGVYITGGTLTVNKLSFISYNTATNGGGIYATGSSTVSIYGQISNNEATYGGGGVYVGTNTVFLKSTGAINNNEASKGGGIYIYQTQVASFSSVESEHKIILKGEINNNSGTGGGIYCRYGYMLFDSVTISGNTGTKNATAIYYGNSDSSDYRTSGGVLRWMGKTAIQGNIFLDNYRCWEGYFCPSDYHETYSSQMSVILLSVGWENNGQIGLSPLDSTKSVNEGFELNHVYWQDLNGDSQTITKEQVQNTFVDYLYGTTISIRTMTFINGKCYIGKVKFQS